MKKQKICIIGGGLAGLATAITLSRLNLEIDLITGNNYNRNIKSNKTTAISQKHNHPITNGVVQEILGLRKSILRKAQRNEEIDFCQSPPRQHGDCRSAGPTGHGFRHRSDRRAAPATL